MGHNKHVDLFKDMIPAVDLGIKELWDASSDDGKKEIIGDLYNLNRYISNVKTSNRLIQEHYVLTVNEFYNKNWTILQKHPKLLWMLLCMCNYDSKTIFYHEWIGLNKQTNTKLNKEKIAFLEKIYPTTKLTEINMMAELFSDNDILEIAKNNGYTETDIKKILK